MELTIDDALKQGIEAHRSGQLQEADRLYTAILQANPKHPDANHNMGVLAVGVGKVESALPFFKAAIEANRTVEQFWLSYINALLKLQRIEEAKALIGQAKDAGIVTDALHQLASQLQAGGIVAPTNREPSSAELQSLVTRYNAGELEGVLKDAHVLLKQFPTSFTLLNLIGAVNFGLKRLDDAIVYYKKAINIKPDAAGVYNNVAVLFKKIGEFQKAKGAYERALQQNPNFAEA